METEQDDDVEVPALYLAGIEEEDPAESHIVRGID
jgi:hypothetical protein